MGENESDKWIMRLKGHIKERAYGKEPIMFSYFSIVQVFMCRTRHSSL